MPPLERAFHAMLMEILEMARVRAPVLLVKIVTWMGRVQYAQELLAAWPEPMSSLIQDA